MIHSVLHSEPPLDSGETSAGMRIVGAAVVAVAAVVCAAFLSAVGAQLALVCTVLAVYAWIVPDARAALVAAGVAYLFLDGFLVNRYGDLSWDGVTSLAQLGPLALTALPACARRWLDGVRGDRALAAELAGLSREPGPTDDQSETTSGTGRPAIMKETRG